MARTQRFFAFLLLCSLLAGTGVLLHQEVEGAVTGKQPIRVLARGLGFSSVIMPTAPTWHPSSMHVSAEPGGVLVLTQKEMTLRESLHPLSVGDPDVRQTLTLPSGTRLQSSIYHSPSGQTVQMLEGKQGPLYVSLIVTQSNALLTSKEITDWFTHLQLESVR